MSEQLGAASVGPSPKEKALEVLKYLKRFVRNPVMAVRDVPSWDWPTLIIFQAVAAMASGLLSGIVGSSLSKILGGVILFPISSTIMMAVVSGFFYYTFLFWFQMEVNFRTLCTVVVICSLPFLVLNTISSVVPPIVLVGFAFTALLLIVALVENFQAPKKHVIRVIGGIMAVYAIFWAVNMINTVTSKEKRKTMITPESIEVLRKELKDE